MSMPLINPSSLTHSTAQALAAVPKSRLDMLSPPASGDVAHVRFARDFSHGFGMHSDPSGKPGVASDVGQQARTSSRVWLDGVALTGQVGGIESEWADPCADVENVESVVSIRSRTPKDAGSQSPSATRLQNGANSSSSTKNSTSLT